jgi:N-acetylneuraminic acid mutarotase
MWWLIGCAGSGDGPDVTEGPPDSADTDPPVVAPGWRVGAALPEPRQECGVVALDGRILVIGGYDGGVQMVDRVEAYDPVADVWETLAPLPVPLHHPNVAVVDGAVHVAGALADGFFEIPIHLVYDADADVWAELPDLPDDRAVGAAGAAVVDGRLHLVGGLQLLRSVALHSVFDPATGAWEALPDAPSARDHLAVGATNGGLVATGGRNGGIGGFVPATERWDPSSGWTVGTPIPTPRGGVAAAVREDGRLDVVGGEGDASDPSGVFDDHEVYDPVTDGWEDVGPMRTPRHGTGGAWVDGTLWIPGGATVEAFGAVAINEGWTP